MMVESGLTWEGTVKAAFNPEKPPPKEKKTPQSTHMQKQKLHN